MAITNRKPHLPRQHNPTRAWGGRRSHRHQPSHRACICPVTTPLLWQSMHASCCHPPLPQLPVRCVVIVPVVLFPGFPYTRPSLSLSLSLRLQYSVACHVSVRCCIPLLSHISFSYRIADSCTECHVKPTSCEAQPCKHVQLQIHGPFV